MIVLTRLATTALVLGTLTTSAIAQTTPLQAARNDAAVPTVGRIVRVWDAADPEHPLAGASVLDVVAYMKDTTTAALVTGKAGAVGLAGFARVRDDTIAECRISCAWVLVTGVGYQPKEQFIALAPADTGVVEVGLDHLAPQLPAVTTTAYTVDAGLREFESHRTNRALAGRFIGPDSLRAWDGQPLSTVLAHFGMRANRAYASMSKKPCRTLYYYDGMEVKGMPLGDADGYAAVEFYSDWTMAPHNFVPPLAGDVCGIYVLWGRDAGGNKP